MRRHRLHRGAQAFHGDDVAALLAQDHLNRGLGAVLAKRLVDSLLGGDLLALRSEALVATGNLDLARQ